MATITTERATIERWGDVQHALSGGGDGRSCQCIWPVVRNKDWQSTSVDERRDLLHDEIATRQTPGLVAYVDGEAAGWIRVGPRTTQLRILNTRSIVGASTEPLDDDSVWAVTCFVVRREHRGTGLNAILLEAAIDHARQGGARLIEAYPVDNTHGTHRANDMFHGALTTFLAAGFTHDATLTGGRVLVTRPLHD
ncbi:GNAT family N-acetyltransferase [Microbacterium esteraromaticum]|uniref:GNAT family N-acetyltransferase n=1 Tax=Microbacterium esteraromaticum TaxID=57043 RepID=UPI003C2C294A